MVGISGSYQLCSICCSTIFSPRECIIFCSMDWNCCTSWMVWISTMEFSICEWLTYWIMYCWCTPSDWFPSVSSTCSPPSWTIMVSGSTVTTSPESDWMVNCCGSPEFCRVINYVLEAAYNACILQKMEINILMKIPMFIFSSFIIHEN